MRRTIGRWIGETTPDQLRSLLYWSLEGRYAEEAASEWTTWVEEISEWIRLNAEARATWKSDPDLVPILADAVASTERCDAVLRRELNFCRRQLALCQGVLDELRGELGRVFEARYDRDGQGEASPALRLAHQDFYMHGVSRRYQALSDQIDEDVVRLREARDRRWRYRKSEQSIPLARLDAMPPSPDFEIEISKLLRRDGCPIEREHGFPGDKNADVIALTPERCLRIVVQVKQRSTKHIEERTLWELNGTAWDIHRGDIVALVTNHHFSDEARKFAKRLGINLIDRDALEMCATYGESLLGMLEVGPRRDRASAALSAA